MFKYFKPYTNLQLYDRTGYFNSILSSSFLSAVDPSCKSTDLQIVCQLEEGRKLKMVEERVNHGVYFLTNCIPINASDIKTRGFES